MVQAQTPDHISREGRESSTQTLRVVMEFVQQGASGIGAWGVHGLEAPDPGQRDDIGEEGGCYLSLDDRNLNPGDFFEGGVEMAACEESRLEIIRMIQACQNDRDGLAGQSADRGHDCSYD